MVHTRRSLELTVQSSSMCRYFTDLNYEYFLLPSSALFRRISLAEAVCMAETESNFYKRVAIDNSISSENCSISFKDAFSGISLQQNEKKVLTIDDPLVLVIALGVSTCCLIGVCVCVIAKLVSENKNRTAENASPVRVPLQRGERLESEADPSSSSTATRRSHEVLLTESRFRSYNTV